MSHSDSDHTVVRLLHVALILGRTEVTVRAMIYNGRLPTPDVTLDRRQYGWRLSTIAAWNPALAEKVAQLLNNPALPLTLTL